jgi:hypothetical protein
MPTGYTADVVSGKVTDLKTFAKQLARGMGALVMMRDAPDDAPIPDRFEPSPYYAESLATAQAKVDRLTAMTNDEAQAEADAEFDRRAAARDAAKARRDEQRQRYDDMIAKVEAWEGAPEGIKEFGLQQLRQGREFDCPEPFKYWLKVEQQDGAVWRAEALKEATRNLDYARESNEKELERVAARNEWLAQLRRSLP